MPVNKRKQTQKQTKMAVASSLATARNRSCIWNFFTVHLSPLATQFLAPPPGSVASERLFSTAGDVCTDSRNRLLPEKLEQLIFLKINLPLVNNLIN